MATSVVSGRIDASVRHRADAIIRNAGLTPTRVIQNVWNSIAETGALPAEALDSGIPATKPSALDRLDKFLETLPPANPEYADATDDELLALKVRDYA